jgi:hypothetical protein
MKKQSNNKEIYFRQKDKVIVMLTVCKWNNRVAVFDLAKKKRLTDERVRISVIKHYLSSAIYQDMLPFKAKERIRAVGLEPYLPAHQQRFFQQTPLF